MRRRLDIGYKTAEELAADESFQNYCLENSKQDVKKWEKRLRNRPELSDTFEEAKFLVHMFTPKHQISSKKSANSKWRNALRIAAGVLILIVAGFLIKGAVKSDYPEITKIAEHTNTEIHLSDLTTVNLRQGGILRYKESWENSKIREVWLEGEAYFDVTKSKPFIVHLPSGDIHVLGTKFLVRADSLHSSVVLEEGKVHFLADDKEFEMSPGDQLSYGENSVSIQSGIDINTYHSWMKSSLAFKNEPLKNVIKTINNSYRMQVELESPKLEDRKISTTINQNDPELLLNAIAEIYNIKLIRKDGKIILR